MYAPSASGATAVAATVAAVAVGAAVTADGHTGAMTKLSVWDAWSSLRIW